MISRYLLTKDSIATNEFGQAYPDIVSFPINKFVYSQDPTVIQLTTADCQRFDLVSYAYYDTSDYTDLLLLLNGKNSFHDLVPGDEIKIPIIDDVNSFYLRFQRK
jgi:hypothetical protein